MDDNEQPMQARKIADACRLQQAYDHYIDNRAPQPADRIVALEEHVATLTAQIERLVIALEQRQAAPSEFPRRALRFSL